MSTKKTKTMMVSSDEQLAVLASPVRIEIIGAFQTQGPCSIRELATAMDRPADGLYHHIRKLLNAGILRVQETRKTERRDEAVYTLVAERVGGKMKQPSPTGKETLIKSAATVMRLATREFATAIKAGEPPCQGETRRLLVSRQKAWLTDEALAELSDLLSRIEKLLLKHNRRKEGRLYVLTSVLVPLVKRRRV